MSLLRICFIKQVFGNLTDGQIKLITGTVTANFKGMPEYGDIYTYDEAISRLKLVLLSTIVKKGKTAKRLIPVLNWRGYTEDYRSILQRQVNLQKKKKNSVKITKMRC